MKSIHIVRVVCVAIGVLSLTTMAKEAPKERPAAQSATKSLGAAGHVRKTTRSDGSTSYVWGKGLDQKNRVSGPHGHMVRDKDGKLLYYRLPDGEVKYDSKKKDGKG